MNQLQVFTNEKFGNIRAVEVNGIPYFVGKDIAEALGYSNARDAIARHVDDEDKADVVIHDGSQNRTMTGVNESGIYALIFGSKLPSAKEFKHWVTSDVLPSIRKTGGYNAKQSDEYKMKRLDVMMINAQARLLKEQNKQYELMMKYGAMPEEEPQQPEKPIEKTYSAEEVGKMLNVSANKIGRTANANNLKIEEYGEWFKDVCKHTDKEVQSFRYNQNGIDKLREILEGSAKTS